MPVLLVVFASTSLEPLGYELFVDGVSFEPQRGFGAFDGSAGIGQAEHEFILLPLT
jgi:hypothetical protein